MARFKCSSNYWLNDETWEIEKDIWIRTVAITKLPTTFFFFLHPQFVLAKQAEAYLAVISRSPVEDKKQPWALFSVQPSRVTGLLCAAWNL